MHEDWNETEKSQLARTSIKLCYFKSCAQFTPSRRAQINFSLPWRFEADKRFSIFFSIVTLAESPSLPECATVSDLSIVSRREMKTCRILKRALNWFDISSEGHVLSCSLKIWKWAGRVPATEKIKPRLIIFILGAELLTFMLASSRTNCAHQRKIQWRLLTFALFYFFKPIFLFSI